MSTELAAIVHTSYRHVDKVATPRGVRGNLKWYELAEPGREIAAETSAAAVVTVEALIDPADVGFVILHDCSGGITLLLVCRWRNANEIWEAVYVSRDDKPFAPISSNDPTRATFCVWELGIVNAERLAWAELLETSRDTEALETYLATSFGGVV